jgi:pimeloyl-ACP methyl ester carboxylesterase
VAKKRLFETLVAALALGATAAPASARAPYPRQYEAEIGFVRIDRDLTVRRMVFANPGAKGTVLFLHGFPETLHAWDGVAQRLASDYEVHAFDWPGYGLSSRPAEGGFAYSPRDYAGVLKAYIRKAGIDRSKLTIYATDIGALPALLLALEEPDIARTIIVGDFAPFDRPEHMYESLQSLKSPATSERTRVYMNVTRDEILENVHRRGLPGEAQFDLSPALKADMRKGWDHGEITSADSFHRYYSAFTRDQKHLEANIERLRTRVKVIWGERDVYIDKAMGVEFAERIGAELTLLPGIGHFPHLQDPERAAKEVRASFR